MHRRLAALLGALALALVSVGTVSADTLGPSASNLYLEWTGCHGSICTANIEIDVLKKGAPQACVFVSDGTNSGSGCTADLGALTYSGKYIVGIANTTFTVPNFGELTVSASSSITDGPVPFSGCGSGDSWRGTIATVAGTLTIGADSGDATGETNIHNTHTVRTC